MFNLLGKDVRRLSAKTRRLAERYLLTDEIAKTIVPADFSCPASGSTYEVYSRNIRLVAENAPLRIIEDELIIGAATYLEATQHNCPGGLFSGVSHTTPDFGYVVKNGLAMVQKQIIESMKQPGRSAKELDFLQAELNAAEAILIWKNRYLKALKTAGGNHEVIRNIERVPELPAESFIEAVQSLWLIFCFTRLCGNWPGLGRVDLILGDYLRRDLSAGKITIDIAREYLAHFWIKGAEWKGMFPGGSGDAQYYQNVILGGIDSNRCEVANGVTDLILEVVEELHISDFPIAVRVNPDTPEELWRKIADVQAAGGGIVAIYNENKVIEALEKFGYDFDEAVGFTNDGCWEVLIPGKTAFGYWPFDAYALLQELLGITGQEIPKVADVQGILELWQAALRRTLTEQAKEAKNFYIDKCAGIREFKQDDDYTPTALLSLFFPNTIKCARSYYNRGVEYNVAAIHAGGLPDVANSLLALEKTVFAPNRMNLADFIEVLKSNWQLNPALQHELKSSLICYGNDDDYADAMLRKVVNSYAAVCEEFKEAGGVLRPVGISTFGREMGYAQERMATPFGAGEHAILSANLSPAPQTDKQGVTAVINSFCKVDFSRIPNGCPLDIKLHSSVVADGKHAYVLAGLMKSFIQKGGFYLQLDVVNEEMLYDAQRRPERYLNLSVRISGWSARFVSLDREWQNLVIQRTLQRQ